MHIRVYEARRRLDQTIKEYAVELERVIGQPLSTVLLSGVQMRLEFLEKQDREVLGGEADLIPLAVGREVAEVHRFREELEALIKKLHDMDQALLKLV